MADVLTDAEQRIGRPLDETYRNTATELEKLTTDLTAGVLAGWQAGNLTDAELEELVHGILVQGVAHGTTIGDAVGSAYIGQQPLGITVDDQEAERLGLAAATIVGLLDAAGDPLPRLARLTVGEALHGLQDGVRRAYSEHGVTGYTRGLSASACELCRWLYKGGHVYPSSKPMHKHPGCTCVPIPVTREDNR